MKRRLALALCLLAGVAFAQSMDLNQGGPIEVTARDGIEWRQQEQLVIARGAGGRCAVVSRLMRICWSRAIAHAAARQSNRALAAKAPVAPAKFGAWKPKEMW